MSEHRERLKRRVEEATAKQYAIKKAQINDNSELLLAELNAAAELKKRARETTKSESSTDDEVKDIPPPVRVNPKTQNPGTNLGAKTGDSGITAKALSGIGAIRKRDGAKIVTDKPAATSREKETMLQKKFGWDFTDTSFYKDVVVPTNVSRADKGQLEKVNNIAKRVEKNPHDKSGIKDLRDAIAAVEFFPSLTHGLIKATGMLRPGKGLVYIIENQQKAFPADVVNDALVLYRRWKTGDIEPNPFRGTSGLQDATLDGSETAAPSANNLVIGQWWPSFACLLRDKVHMATQAGIAGNKEDGAQSIVLSGGKASENYHDIDRGDVIHYSGTLSDASITYTTGLMRKVVGKPNHSLRVFRNHNLRSDWAPKVGIRYDGLYIVVSEEEVDSENNHWVFKLERLPAQDPIRSANIDASLARPSQAEITNYSKYWGNKQASKAKGTSS